MSFKRAVFLLVVFAVVFVGAERLWDRYQFSKNYTAIQAVVVEFRPVPPQSPPGTGPEAVVRLQDNRQVNVSFASTQTPLEVNQKILLWLNNNDGHVISSNAWGRTD